jgi:hypothetical protein
MIGSRFLIILLNYSVAMKSSLIVLKKSRTVTIEQYFGFVTVR